MTWRLAGAAAGALAAGVVLAAQAPAVTLHSLNAFDVQYVLSAGGINTLALLREDGVVLIDPLPRGMGKATLEALAAVTDQPVTIVVHIRAGEEFLAAGLEYPTATEIVASRRVAERMRALPAFQTPAGATRLPTRVVEGEATLLDGPDRMILRTYGPALTDGDLFVLLPEKRLAYFSDAFAGRRLPAVDPSKGGGLVALSRALAPLPAAVPGIRSVVPGREAPRQAGVGTHKPLSEMPITLTSSWKDFEDYAAFLTEFVAGALAARAAGRPATAAGVTVGERFKAFDLAGADTAVASVYAESAGR